MDASQALKRLAVVSLILSILLAGFPIRPHRVFATSDANIGGFLYAWEGEKKTAGTSNPHNGNAVDFVTLSGSQEYSVLTPKEGVVVDYFDAYPNTPQSTCGGYSRSLFVNYVLLGHGPFTNGKYDHYTLIYHLVQGSASQAGVQIGNWVKLGQRIGTAGNTGESTANHVHMEVSRNEPGLNTSRSYYCNNASIPVAKHRATLNPTANTVSYGFEEQANQWPVENGATNTSVGQSYNHEGLGTVNLGGTSNLRQCGKDDDVRLFNHIDYGGECVAVINTDQVTNIPSWMHVSSVYLKPSWTTNHTLTIWDDINNTGNYAFLQKSTPDMRDYRFGTWYESGYWQDRIKSIHNSLQGTGIDWLAETSFAGSPLEVDIHVRVVDFGDFDAFRVCFDGDGCQETAATELYYTWNTYGYDDGNHVISIEYRVESDGGNWRAGYQCTSSLRLRFYSNRREYLV